jgi:hypothetical protein
MSLSRSAAGLIACLLLVTNAFAQGGISATLSGTVSDASGALIPGVEVAAKNTETGVTSTSITNENGSYRFPSLQPGPYEVNAMLTGFQSQTFRLTLGTSQQIRQNFALQVGGVAQAVEVTVAADELPLNTTNIGVNVPAGETIAGATLRSSGLFPENFIVANPQFATMEMRNNSDTSTYHSMQTQFTMRPRRGVNHPTPENPNLDINSGTFGEITTKTGSRTLAGQIRLEF